MRTILSIILVLFSAQSFAGWEEFRDSNWYEPVIVGTLVGTGTYFGATQDGKQGTYAAGAFAVSALLTWAVNSHYEEKYSRADQRKIDRLTEELNKFTQLQAIKAANHDPGPYSNIVREYVPAQVDSKGQVRAPTVIEKLVAPGSDTNVGND